MTFQSFSLEFPVRFLRGSYTRLALTVVALTCGVALICAMTLVNRAVLGAFIEVVDATAGRAALTVTAGGAPCPESIADDLAALHGVQRAVPVVSGTAFTADSNGELLTVHGIDITDESAVRVYEARDAGGLEIDDPLAFLNQLDSIIVTRSWAHRRRVRVGDTVDLLTATGHKTFTVRGLLEPQGIARIYGGNLIVMDLAAAEMAFTHPGMINRIDIVARRDANVSDIAAAIGGALPTGLRVERPSQRKADLQRVMRSFQVILDTISIIGLAAAFLIILNRLTTVFETRAWQLGVMHAIGMRPRAIWWELLKESVVLGTIGAGLGIPLGLVAGWLLLPIVATTAALNFKLVATEANFNIGTFPIIKAGLFGLSTAALAATLPAWRVAHRSPIETMRGRGVSPPARNIATWLIGSIVLAMIVITLTLQHFLDTPSWGLIATALIVIITALAARPALQFISPSLLAALSAMLGAGVHLARAGMRRNNPRAILTISLLGVGIGAIIWLRTLAFSFESTLVHALSGAMQADWVVSASHTAQGFLESPLDERLVGELRKLPDVAYAVGERLVDWRYDGRTVGIDAFDSDYFSKDAFGRLPLVSTAIPNAWEIVGSGRAVLLSGNFGVRVGDAIQLETPTGSLAVTVAGTTIDFASPGGTIVMARELYRQRWADAQVNRVFVRVAQSSSAENVRVLISRAFGTTYGLRIISASELITYFVLQVRRAFAPLDVLAGLMLTVLLIGLADTLAASALERILDLAVTRALGARRSLLACATIAEGLSIGFPGVFLAVTSGVILGAVWIWRTFPLLIGWPLETYIPYAQIMVIGAATVVVCGLAGWVSSRRATSFEPVSALRSE